MSTGVIDGLQARFKKRRYCNTEIWAGQPFRGAVTEARWIRVEGNSDGSSTA